jgi:hypothetical protein
MTATGEALEATSSSAPSELLVQPARLEHLDDLVANNIAMAKVGSMKSICLHTPQHIQAGCCGVPNSGQTTRAAAGRLGLGVW